MKKEIKIAIAVVLSIWFFVMGFELGIYKERKAHVQQDNEVVNTVTPSTTQPTAPTTDPTTAPTAQPSTTQPTTVLPPVVDPNQNSTAPTQEPSSQAPANNDPSSLSKAEIIEKMNGYMKDLKAEQNVKAHKSENITVEIVDCSVPAAISLINSVISGIAGAEELDYAFTNGATASGETVFGVIPPTNKDFALTDAGVLSATAKASGADTVYTVVLVAENTSIASPSPAHNSVAIGYLDIASLDLPGVTMQEADMKYPGSTVEIAVNADGKVTKLVNKMPMEGNVTAKISFFNGNASFKGGLDESWTFTY